MRLVLLAVQLQRHISVLLHVEELLEQLLHVVVGLGRRLHEIALPRLRLRLPVRALHLPGVALVALVPHQHDRELHLVALDLPNHLPDRPQLLQALATRDGVDEDEGVSFADGEPLHGRELVGARRVRDLERADVLVAADHLAIRVFDGGYVGLPEGALDEAQDQGGLADASCPEHHHAVVVTLFRHLLTPVWFRRVLQRREPGVGVVVVVVVGSGWQEAITRGLEEEERERGDALNLFVS